MSDGVRHEALWNWLQRRRVKHSEFAEAMGKAPATVSNWLHLRGRPDLETLDRVAKWTGIPVQALIDGFLCRKPSDRHGTSPPANVTDLRVAKARRAANKNG